MDTFDPSILFRIVDVTGVVANGLLGGAVARSRGFDPVGFVFMAIISALGGGIIRDVMLNDGPPVALTDPLYLGGALAAAAVTFVLNLEGKTTKRMLLLADVLALGCWSATGASKALAVGLQWLPAIFLGVVTAVGGGMLRDVFVNEIPAVFGGTPLYATVAMIASAEMVVLQRLGQFEIGMALAILISAALGLTARRRNWVLPGAASLEWRRRRRR